MSEVLIRDRKKLQSTYHRILLGIASIDFICTLAFSLSTWPSPAGTRNVVGAKGTTATCTAQGFIVNLILASPCYNFSLSLYFFLTIACCWKDSKTKKIEPFMHAFSISFALITSVVGLFLKLFNNANVWCWIARFPAGCVGSNCIRGRNADFYRWVLAFIPIWIIIFAVTVLMILLVRAVRKQEQSMEQYRYRTANGDGAGSSSRRSFNNATSVLSKKVAWQAFWYVLAFYVTWIPSTTTRAMQLINQKRKVPFGLVVAQSIVFPMQGFFNFLIYIRPRYQRYREGSMSAQAAVIKLVRKSIMFWTQSSQGNEDDHTGAEDREIMDMAFALSVVQTTPEKRDDIMDVPENSAGNGESGNTR